MASSHLYGQPFVGLFSQLRVPSHENETCSSPILLRLFAVRTTQDKYANYSAASYTSGRATYGASFDLADSQDLVLLSFMLIS